MNDTLRYELNVDFKHDRLIIFEIYGIGSVHLVSSRPLNDYDGRGPDPEVIDWLEFEGFTAEWRKIGMSSCGYVYPLKEIKDVHES